MNISSLLSRKEKLCFAFGAILIAIISWGIFLRVYALPHASLWMDEGYSYVAATTLLHTGGITLETGFVYGPHSIVFHALQALSIWLFGATEWGLRFPSLVFGSIFPVLVFFILTKTFPQKKVFAGGVAGFLALSSWQISWSIQGRMYMVLQVFFLGSLFALWKFFTASVPREKIKWSILFLCTALLSSFTHGLGLTLLGIAFALFPFFQKKFTKNKWYFVSIFLITGFFGWGKLDYLGKQVLSGENFSPFYFRFLWDQHLWLLFSGVLSIGITLLRNNKQYTKFILFCVSNIFVYLMAISFFIPAINYRYIFPVFPLFVILSFSWLSWADLIKKIYVVLFLFLQILFLSSELSIMPKEFLPLESDTPNIEGYRAYTPQPDFRSAVEKIRAIKNTTDILITSYPEITRFYELEANFVLPFSWEVKTEWEHLNKPEYISIKYFYDLLELHKTIMTQSGFLLLDSYSWSKLPDRVTGYIETNLELVWEQWENQDSGVMVFGF